ncbi:MAG TPA: hypothetical protein H9945_08925 [Candidatus Gemmiger avicola]|uniref:TM2 domain-containing protein n=1 Tax=Candidatus Gemmiger avicola TaxID=2838605 RepID=A0A9D2S449_9FIRM|nr:hypothetical protein [Candidatus Gemmiger avicola]
MKKNAFLTFLFACIPGAGQMYYGYMRRGLSLIVMCCVAAGVGSILPPIMLAVPVIWMYAFFDTYDLIRYMAAGTPKEDTFLWGDKLNWDQLRLRTPVGNKLIGWGLVLIGAWVIFADWLVPILGDLLSWLGVPFLSYYLSQLPTLLVAALLIVFGLRLVRRTPNHNADLPPYPGAGHDHTHNDFPDDFPPA